MKYSYLPIFSVLVVLCMFYCHFLLDVVFSHFLFCHHIRETINSSVSETTERQKRAFVSVLLFRSRAVELLDHLA